MVSVMDVGRERSYDGGKDVVKVCRDKFGGAVAAGDNGSARIV